MSRDDLDLTEAMAVDSTRLNADDLISGSITVQITGAKTYRANGKQRVQYAITGGHMPWHPCKTQMRLMTEIAGSPSARPWVGKWVALFRDPEVTFGSDKTGGVRLAAVDASMLDRPREFSVRTGKTARTTYEIDVIRNQRNRGAPTADLDGVLADAGLTVADLDAYRATLGKSPTSDLTADQRAQMAVWLADPRNADKVRPSADTGTAREPGEE
ncbi:MAG TPA: hypothetical protein VI911_04200 [Patescibacteria group bacterium]|nr:hypothetical protein [Patescibacteria group bacterium]